MKKRILNRILNRIFLGYTNIVGSVFNDYKYSTFRNVNKWKGLVCATGHPSLVMCNSFSNQVFTQLQLWLHRDKYENKVCTLPKYLDEKIVALHLEKIGVELETLSKDQADYIGVMLEGPFKPEHYRS